METVKLAFVVEGKTKIAGGALAGEGTLALKTTFQPEKPLKSPKLLVGEKGEKPIEIKLEPVTWKSGKKGFRGSKKGIRVNITRFATKEIAYGLDVRLTETQEAEIPAGWL